MEGTMMTPAAAAMGVRVVRRRGRTLRRIRSRGWPTP
jgi:hypothetical protein